MHDQCRSRCAHQIFGFCCMREIVQNICSSPRCRSKSPKKCEHAFHGAHLIGGGGGGGGLCGQFLLSSFLDYDCLLMTEQ